ncbi:tetratricopeptide repeat-containing glycosyltransferase family protein [Crenobacter sp. SG2305]|uniref:tetratricopeptide repeat-containing glycosyltransferase family protein n=1 Tax=Crenobacter oryzisoli TaxID=3056844 RepID=UPI0025AA5CD9|nr:tetratricopeptide repeat-containing glycosyltransferase family protein [Crenobacter sp. SG2305]MDN0084852.1 tetratricopeptide repeat-containing glycosyltransferase family protein [Crenobacter sp. SG2305]
MSADFAQAEAAFHEGNQRMEAGDAEGAAASFRRALAFAPGFAEALANLGYLHELAGAIAEAEECYRQAIAGSPDCIQVYLNLGVLLMNGKRFADAEAVYRQALAVAPDSSPVWSSLGVLLACAKREDEAERCYRTALELDGTDEKVRFNLGYVLLRQGRFEEGWRCLEARTNPALIRQQAFFACPRWQGEPLAGKSIVVGFEAGHGDMIQFCRYTAVLKRMGATRVTVVCHPGLKTLFASLPGADEVLSFQDAVPSSGWDFWTLPMSLPHHCRTHLLDDIPAAIPYLAAEPERVAHWSHLLPEGQPRVGLVWKGNAHFENDAERSLPCLGALAPLAAVAGVQYVSLQKGPGEQEADHPPAGLSLLPLGAALQDFADTAALVANLDLVISVDTAVAHLAGALGKPCWVLLPDYRTDWRWLTDRSDTPWYPERMRLFRQPPGGDWDAVVADVVRALQEWTPLQHPA